MMRIGIIILCLLGFFVVNGQRFSNLNVFEGSDGGSQADLVIKTIELYDLNGILVGRISLIEQTNVINLNQPTDTYILKFQRETKGTVYKKLIIQ